MATLKYRGNLGFGWVTGVQSVATGKAWEVPSEQFGTPDHCRTESIWGSGWNTISHGIADTGAYDGSITDQRKSWTAVELLVETDHGTRVHIVSAGECWLMGDDGRTIDRIP